MAIILLAQLIGHSSINELIMSFVLKFWIIHRFKLKFECTGKLVSHKILVKIKKSVQLWALRPAPRLPVRNNKLSGIPRAILPPGREQLSFSSSQWTGRKTVASAPINETISSNNKNNAAVSFTFFNKRHFPADWNYKFGRGEQRFISIFMLEQSGNFGN